MSSDAENDAVMRMLSGKRIAVVGLSDDPGRPSFTVCSYLQLAGKTIVPVNPSIREALGQPAVASLKDVAGPVDLVCVFRRPNACEQIAREAVEIGAKGLWLQSGITNDAAEAIAADAGIDFVQDRCMMVEHARRISR